MYVTVGSGFWSKSDADIELKNDLCMVAASVENKNAFFRSSCTLLYLILK